MQVTEEIIIGIQEDLTYSFRIYPNPVRDHAVLTIDNPENSELFVRIINIQGKSMFQQEVRKSESILLTKEGLSAGMYLIVLEGADSRISRKIIVQ